MVSSSIGLTDSPTNLLTCFRDASYYEPYGKLMIFSSWNMSKTQEADLNGWTKSLLLIAGLLNLSISWSRQAHLIVFLSIQSNSLYRGCSNADQSTSKVWIHTNLPFCFFSFIQYLPKTDVISSSTLSRNSYIFTS